MLNRDQVTEASFAIWNNLHLNAGIWGGEDGQPTIRKAGADGEYAGALAIEETDGTVVGIHLPEFLAQYFEKNPDLTSDFESAEDMVYNGYDH